MTFNIQKSVLKWAYERCGEPLDIVSSRMDRPCSSRDLESWMDGDGTVELSSDELESFAKAVGSGYALLFLPSPLNNCNDLFDPNKAREQAAEVVDKYKNSVPGSAEHDAWLMADNYCELYDAVSDRLDDYA